MIKLCFLVINSKHVNILKLQFNFYIGPIWRLFNLKTYIIGLKIKQASNHLIVKLKIQRIKLKLFQRVVEMFYLNKKMYKFIIKFLLLFLREYIIKNNYWLLKKNYVKIFSVNYHIWILKIIVNTNKNIMIIKSILKMVITFWLVE